MAMLLTSLSLVYFHWVVCEFLFSEFESYLLYEEEIFQKHN